MYRPENDFSRAMETATMVVGVSASAVSLYHAVRVFATAADSKGAMESRQHPLHATATAAVQGRKTWISCA